MAVDLDHMPARHTKTRGDILADRQRGGAVIGDAVVVPQEDQLAQSQVAGQRNRLLADAFLQAAVANEGVGEVVDECVAEAGIEMGLGQRHPQRVGNALAERAGGDFDAGAWVVLGVARAMRAEFAE